MLLAVVVLAVLAYLAGNISPQLLEAYRARQTSENLARAREALLGYAMKYRDEQGGNTMYGYLPLPDLGTSRNNNVGCTSEGCDAGNFGGNGIGVTVIGRLPWRTLGTEPIRDGYGECLWYAVSGSHQRIQTSSPMNWDTLGQLDIQVANGSTALASALASPHDRPVAVIFSSGPPLPTQDRSASTSDDVSVCGGKYDVANYLDAATAATANYFDATPAPVNHASGDTSATNKSLTVGGAILQDSSSQLWPDACAAGTSCSEVANDRGLVLDSATLFGALRKSSGFRTDINAMLDRMVSCLRDDLAAGGSITPAAISGFSAPSDKTAGRLPSNTCYDDNQHPLGYFSNYGNQVFVASASSGSFSVTSDGVTQSCPSVLIFANQRSSAQLRATSAQQNTPSNYLEGTNLASFTAAGNSFDGATRFRALTSGQPPEQDVVRCVPASPSFLPVDWTPSDGEGGQPFASYDPGTGTLTLGQSSLPTGDNAPAVSQLFACAWMPDAYPLANGFRVYFQFQFQNVGGGAGGVGDTGFNFAAVDADKNGTDVCGASASHLGYSGDNGTTPPIVFPKLGVEFDLNRDAGRNDPNGQDFGKNYDTHAAIVYWGTESSQDDDNVHGAPTSTTGSRPPPQNPSDLNASPSGIELIDLRGHRSGSSYLYHVRVEVIPTRTSASQAELNTTKLTTQVWILRNGGQTNMINALQNTTRSMAQLYPGYAPTLQDSATIYDVAGNSCSQNACGTGQSCGSDHVCYRPALNNVRLGFTASQYDQGLQVNINKFVAAWPQ